MSPQSRKPDDIPSRAWQRMIPHLELGDGIRARHIQVDMARAKTYDLYAKAGNVLASMKDGRYEYVPVTSKGRVVGYIGRAQLTRIEPDLPIRNVTRSLAGGAIVAADTPIHEVMDYIAKQRIVFVLDGRTITGFVTVWDFNKQPARMYYYLVLAGLEIVLADLVRWRYGRNQSNLLAHLGSRDSEEVMDRVQRDGPAASGDLVSYLNFKHLLRIFEKDASLRREVGKFDPGTWRARTKPLGELRNEVMHPVTTLIRKPEDMTQLAESIDTAVDISDRAIDSLREHYEAALSKRK